MAEGPPPQRAPPLTLRLAKPPTSGGRAIRAAPMRVPGRPIGPHTRPTTRQRTRPATTPLQHARQAGQQEEEAIRLGLDRLAPDRRLDPGDPGLVQARPDRRGVPPVELRDGRFRVERHLDTSSIRMAGSSPWPSVEMAMPMVAPLQPAACRPRCRATPAACVEPRFPEWGTGRIAPASPRRTPPWLAPAAPDQR